MIVFWASILNWWCVKSNLYTMAKTVTIKNEGKLPDIKVAERAILMRATQAIRSEAVINAPYDTGLLRKSISGQVTQNYGKV